MDSASRAAALRAQAATLDALADIEQAATRAKAAYQAQPSRATKAAHIAAQEALREARWTARGGQGSHADALATRRTPPTGDEIEAPVIAVRAGVTSGGVS